TGQLFWRCELRSHGVTAFEREQRRGCRIRVVDKEFGNAKVQKLHFAFAADQYIGRLDVAMDDEVGVGVRNGGENIQKKLDSFIHAEHALITIFVELFTLDILENEIGFPIGGHAGVRQRRDVRMRKLAENSALALEAFGCSFSNQGKIQKLDCHAPSEAAVVAFPEPDAPHAALTNGREQLVSTDCPAW